MTSSFDTNLMQREKRSSVRRPIKLAAKFSLESVKDQACTVSDFCTGGLLIQYDQKSEYYLVSSNKVHAGDLGTISFTSLTSNTNYEVQVRIKRILNQAMGLEFVQAEPEAVAAMLQFFDTAKPKHKTEISTNARQIAIECRTTIVEEISHFVDPLFEAIKDDFNEAISYSENEKQKSVYVESITTFIGNRNKIIQRLAESASKQVAISDGTISKLSDSELSLVDKGDFEKWLMIKVMISNADALYRESLYELKTRSDKASIDSPKGLVNPLGPGIYVHAFNDALATLRLPFKASQLLFSALERVMLKDLAPLYKKLNQVFISHGVLAGFNSNKENVNLKDAKEFGEQGDTQEPRNNPAKGLAQQSQSPAPRTSQTRNSNFTPAPELKALPETGINAFSNTNRKAFSLNQGQATSAINTAQDLFAMLRNARNAGQNLTPELLAEQRDQESNYSNASFAESIARIQAETLQTVAAPATVSPLVDRVTHQLKEIDSDDNLTLAPQQEEALHIVDTFFESMEGNQKLTPEIKSLIRKLEATVLKALVKDPDFFSDSDSPVRKIINSIGKLGYVDRNLTKNQASKLISIIEDVNQYFDTDDKHVEAASQKLEAMAQREDRSSQKNAERVIATAAGLEKVAESKRIVQQELDGRIAGRSIPLAIQTLLEEGWQELLAFTYLRQGVDSAQWAKYLAVLDTLLAYADNPEREIDLPATLSTIKEGLAYVSSTSEPSQKVRSELKDMFNDIKSNNTQMVEVPEKTKAEKGNENKDLAALEFGKKALTRWVRRAGNLQVGDWLIQYQDDKSPLFIRLAWIDNSQSEFIFVNHLGIKVLELTLAELIVHLKTGTIVVDNNHERDLFEESMDNTLKSIYDQVAYISSHDELTGLINRPEFKRCIDSELSKDMEELDCSLCYIDLRQFKLINDSVGYEAGDALLKEISNLLQSIAPKGTVIGRLGANEFGAVLKEDNVDAFGKQVFAAIQEYRFLWKGQSYTIAANIGISGSDKHSINADILLNSAEHACQVAKTKGLNKLQQFSHDDENDFEVVSKVAGLYSAFDLNNVSFRTQKIIPVAKTKDSQSMQEVWLSIFDDTGGLISAKEFIRAAEHYNQIEAVDQFVVGKIFDWMLAHPDQIEKTDALFINISARSLRDDSLVNYVFDRLEESELPMDKVCFELTELAAIDNLNEVAALMNELKETGCQFSLGDFGVGSSSLDYMKNLPVDFIKIDGSFIRNLSPSSPDLPMVKAVSRMARFMGLKVIAEQVEEKEAFIIIKHLGIDYAQGFLIDKPKGLIDG